MFADSIRRRLLVFLALPLILLRLLGAVSNYNTNVSYAQLVEKKRMLEVAQALAHGLPAMSNAIHLPGTTISASLIDGNPLRYAIVAESGQLIAGDASLPTLANNGRENPVYRETKLDGRWLRAMTYRINTANGNVTINIGGALSNPAIDPRLPLWRDLLWDFFELDISLLLIWLGVHFGLRPLDRLRAEIDARSPEDLQPLDDHAAPMELRPLIRSLNRLFEVVNSTVQSQNQFIANAAHQLRTPIAGLVAQIDLLLMESGSHEQRKRLEVLLDGLNKLTRSANQLLTLSRAESDLSLLSNKRVVDLREIITDVTSRMIDHAIGRTIEIRAELESALVRADPSLLEELVSNLIDNALKYTPEGGEVVIESGLDHDQPFVQISDTGPGIMPAERNRVIQRFYRSPGTKTPGSGLGLAIVNEIARMHGATLVIDAGPGGSGTRVRVQWRNA